MGEVYRAKDTRLDRVVAIKVLPSHLSNNTEVQQRFEREARAVSSLSHSNICTLYDVGRQDGIDYLVMEYVDGESLADRLSKGPLPLDQVLRYSIQMADALDRAHHQGIVHRDLKPGNIMLTKSGAKLLDFGIAKFLDHRSRGSSAVFSGLSNLPTEPVSLTGEGAVLGTVQYMAPEQLEGRDADSRTDIFAFGTVVYEMATGKKAFTGKSQASLIGAILRDDPPTVSTTQSMTPPALDRVVKTCLAKDPDDRWQSARDLAQELKWIAEGGSQAGTPMPASTPPKSRERIAWLVAAVFLAAAALLATPYVFHRSPVEPGITRFNIPPPEKATFGDSSAISPDGRLLAFTAKETDGKVGLWIRPLDSVTPKVLGGTHGANSLSGHPTAAS
jgi:eukaryotic-like serine/threonine-protein kinase